MEKTELHPQIFPIEDLSVKARRKTLISGLKYVLRTDVMYRKV
ncbi:hypothetical protein [Chryseobacterium gregarium]|nr:hypothetical protein [Chryseobacterium gregarium]